MGVKTLKDIKQTTTISEQIEKLKKRGLIVENVDEAEYYLRIHNYYSITGYLHAFKKDEECYCDGTTFGKMCKIYEFDRRIKNILLYALEIVEHTLKAKISYNFSHVKFDDEKINMDDGKLNPLAYLTSTYFQKEDEHRKFKGMLKTAVKRNSKIPFIAHHLANYEGKIPIPIWVSVEIWTMGMTSNFYRNMPNPIKRKVANEYGTGMIQLESWVENIRYLRNLVAHGMRLYDFKIQKTPKKCKALFDYHRITYKIFDIVYIMKFLIFDVKEWNNYILKNIKTLFDEYSSYIDISALGFPNNWQEVLYITEK